MNFLTRDFTDDTDFYFSVKSVLNDIECPDRVIPYESEQVLEQGEVELSPHSVTVIQTL